MKNQAPAVPDGYQRDASRHLAPAALTRTLTAIDDALQICGSRRHRCVCEPVGGTAEYVPISMDMGAA